MQTQKYKIHTHASNPSVLDMGIPKMILRNEKFKTRPLGHYQSTLTLSSPNVVLVGTNRKLNASKSRQIQ